jgi:hypothetical protein
LTTQLRPPDWLVALGFGLWACAAFMTAGDDFSYDYGNYIGYFERLADFGAEDLWAQMQAFFPYPYVLIPPAGFLETGFALLMWSLLSLGLSSGAAYATAGTLSIMLRILLMRALGLRWPAVLLATVYSVTLFEANAIRLGCALTATIAALWAWRRQSPVASVLLLIAAASFHLQSLAFNVPFAAAALLFPWIDRYVALRWSVLVVTVIAAAAIVLAPGVVDFAKLGEYANSEAASVGINAASLTGLLALILASAVFISRASAVTAAERRDALLWSSAYVATLPALVLILLATSMGALGDRVWQFAFVCAVTTLPLGQSISTNGSSRWWVTLYSGALHLCLLVSVFNVTLRYPLSNFFAPLLPFVPISPATLIL